MAELSPGPAEAGRSGLSSLGSLASVRWTRILTTPIDEETDEPPPLRRAILAGLLDAALRGSTVASLWVRTQPWTPLNVLVASALPMPEPPAEAEVGRRSLLFPLGTTGEEVDSRGLGALLSRFSSWVPCIGSIEPLREDQEEQGSRMEARWIAAPLDDVASYLAHQAFAWLVICHPTPDDDVEKELLRLGRELFRLNQAGRQSEREAVEAERLQVWFRELARAGSGGTWSVDMLVGSTTAADVVPLASIFASAAEHSVSLYKFRPDTSSIISGAKDGLPDTALDGGGAKSFLATSDLVASLVRPPESEIPGLRTVSPPMFDTTPERFEDDEHVELGSVLDRFLRPVGRLQVGLDTLNRHSFVCGATGGGKSQTVRSLLESLSRREKPIPWLVIEPAKAEYARMAGRISDLPGEGVLVIAPGNRDAAPASINPLEPASLEPGNPDRTFPLQSHADLVRALFLAAFRAEEPFPQVLSRALTECYEGIGWDLVTGEAKFSWDRESGQPPFGEETPLSYPRYPSLQRLQQTAQRVVADIGYDEDAKRRVSGFVDVRIGSLRLGAPGRLFEGGHPLDFAAVLHRNVVLEIESITNDQDKAFVMGAFLIRLYEQLLLEERERFERDGGSAPLRHITVIEEAHRLLRNVGEDSPIAHALELFSSLLAEVRAYGEGIIVAEQIPSKLIPDVIKNTALKIVHRLPAADDRESVGATMNLSDGQSKYIVTLEPGSGAIFADGWDRPILAKINLGIGRESTAGVRVDAPSPDNRRRSAACTGCCAERPCVLQEIRHGERLLTLHPELRLWAETSVIVHQLGYPGVGLADSPSVQSLRALHGSDPWVVECALTHALEAAISSRYEKLIGFYDPDHLAAHLSRIGQVILRGGEWASMCADDHGRWRAGRHRFSDLELELDRASPSGTAPKSVGQAGRERGLDLPSGTPAAQLGYLRSLPWRRQVGGSFQYELLAGDRVHPAVLEVAKEIAPDLPPESQLGQAFSLLVWGRPEWKQDVERRITAAPSNRKEASNA